MYQSEVWKEYWAEASERLARHPLVRVEWTERAPGETIDLSIKDRPQAPNSMEIMRKTMIGQTSPVAMIAIGGMKGVLDEARIFAGVRPGKPIYSLATTGGAAAILPRREEYHRRVRVADSEAEKLVSEFWHRQNQRTADERSGGEGRFRQLLHSSTSSTQQIVAEIVTNNATDRP